MKLSVAVTTYRAKERQEPVDEALACYKDLADEVVVVDDPWPKEFSWDFIGQSFHKGYARATGDWVIRADCDYFFHENDMAGIRDVLSRSKAPAMTFYKRQFIKWDEFTIKSRVAIAVNKGVYKDRIKLNSGGDLCQPSLDGKLLDAGDLPEAGYPFWNYDFVFKDQATIMQDFPRFARAWISYFGEARFGGPDDESAFEYFLQMMRGRYKARATARVDLKDHPKYIQKKLSELNPAQHGWNLWGFANA